MATTNESGRTGGNPFRPSGGGDLARRPESSADSRRCATCGDEIRERSMGPLGRLVGRAGWDVGAWCRRCRAFAVLELAGRELAGALREFEARMRRMGRAS